MTLRQMMMAVLCVAFVLVLRPVCPIYATFHVLCPGCGGTRALLALLRGDLGTAWRMNALLVGGVPVVLGYFAVGWWRFRRVVWPGGVGIWAVGVVVAVFTVVRNVWVG